MDTFFSYKKNGVVNRWTLTDVHYVVYDLADGAVEVAEQDFDAEIASTGIFRATLDTSGWDDGWYLIHKYIKSISNSKYGYQGVYIEDGEVVSAEGEKDIIANFNTWKADWTATRAGYVDKLNVSGALAHADAAATYKADVSNLDVAISTRSTPAQVAANTTLLENGTYGLEAIRNEVKGMYSAAMGAPTTDSMADLLMNKDGSKTFSKATDSNEAIRDQGDSSWGSSGTNTYQMVVAVNSQGSTNYFAASLLQNGQVDKNATTLSLDIWELDPAGSPTKRETVTIAAPSADGIFDAVLTMAPASGKLYAVEGTILYNDADSKDLVAYFVAQ